MKALWPRYRTEATPADLDAMRDRFNAVWAGIERQQQQRGYAGVDWAATMQMLKGEVA